MNGGRITVEWAFKEVTLLWKYPLFAKQMKMLLSPVGHVWLQAAFLTNVHQCMYHSCQASTYFGVDPPGVEEYVRAPRNP